MRSGNDYSETLLVHYRRIESLKEKAVGLRSLELNNRQLCDLELLLTRAFYPLNGYMGRDDYESVLDRMRLDDGSLAPIPICLDVSENLAEAIEPGEEVALRDQEGFMLAVLSVTDTWKADKKREALAVYGTDDPDKHPGVRRLMEETGPCYIGGDIEGIHLPVHYDFKELRLTPSESHRRFLEMGWRNIAAYHAEDYLHCSHREMTLRAATEEGANIFLHAEVENSNPGDIRYYCRIRCYREILKKYPKNVVMMAIIPYAARQAGPREALWLAIMRKNYGCSHFMVADDQCDPFSRYDSPERFYPLHAAQELVLEHQDETGIRMIPLKKMVYVEDKAQFITEDEIQPGMQVKNLSAAEFQRRLEMGLRVPEWFSYPEVVEELQLAFPPRSKQGITIFLTGLSGSGKSTLAKVLLTKFMEMRDRPVTLLDGDVVRKNLSCELNFSREHRNLNVSRIGFVASEITKNGGVALCAPIAPYEESRRQNRELISRCGGYVEVYLCTPLDVCEQRDRKGSYAKARAGKIKGFTGIDDPYIPPSHPEIVLDTSEVTPEEAAQEVLLYLAEQGYIR